MRIVITGGPSTGKTTIISLLEAKGFPVVHEQATQIIKEGKFLPWIDRAAFQDEVLQRQLAAEATLNSQGRPVFLDRGLFDGEAYYVYDKLEIPAIFSKLDATRYVMAFLIEELSFFDKNEVRRESLEFTKAISNILEDCYRKRHVSVVRVPALSPAERVEFILQKVEQTQCLPVQPQKVIGTTHTTYISAL